MRRLIAFALVLLAARSAHAAAGPLPAYREVLNLRYAPGAGNRHTLDVFIPAGYGEKKASRPVVLFVHGGTWMAGDKNFFGMYRGVGRALASGGMVAVLANYRLSPRVRHPEHVKDVACAFAWTYRNVHRYGGDPSRIFLAGHSAGAHLVSLLITDETYLKDPELKLDDAARRSVRGVVSVSGVYRIPAPDEFHLMARRIVENLVGEPDSGGLAAKALAPALLVVGDKVNPFGLVFGKDRDVQTRASPLTHVRKGLPPFLVLNAEREVPGLWPMADEFVAALKKNGVPVDHQEIGGATHRTIVKRLHNPRDDAARLVLEFVGRQAALAAAAAPLKGG